MEDETSVDLLELVCLLYLRYKPKYSLSFVMKLLKHMMHCEIPDNNNIDPTLITDANRRYLFPLNLQQISKLKLGDAVDFRLVFCVFCFAFHDCVWGDFFVCFCL